MGRVPSAARASSGYDPEAVEAAARERAIASARKVVQEGGFFGLRGAIGTPEQMRDYLRATRSAASTR